MISILKMTTQPKSQNSIRVVTWNVHFGERTQWIVEIFKNNKHLREADIIFLQEIEDHESEKISRARRIADTLGLECVYAPARNVPQKGTHGLAILSRYKISEVESVS